MCLFIYIDKTDESSWVIKCIYTHLFLTPKTTSFLFSSQSRENSQRDDNKTFCSQGNRSFKQFRVQHIFFLAKSKLLLNSSNVLIIIMRRWSYIYYLENDSSNTKVILFYSVTLKISPNEPFAVSHVIVKKEMCNGCKL
jgi:hypothetical protein